MMIQQAATYFSTSTIPLLPQGNYAIESVIDQTRTSRVVSARFNPQTAVYAAERTMERILVVGSSGSGKSTLSRRLGGVLQLPVIHLDRHFWHPGWQETPFSEWQSQVRELVAGERWIIDGNYRNTLDMRLDAADTIVFLDLPRMVCVMQAVKRRFQYMRVPRPDIAQGCREHLFDPHFPQFVRRIWEYPYRAKPLMLAKLAEMRQQKTVIHLTSRTAVSQFLTEPKQFPAGLQGQVADVACGVDGSAGVQFAFDEGNSR